MTPGETTGEKSEVKTVDATAPAEVTEAIKAPDKDAAKAAVTKDATSKLGEAADPTAESLATGAADTSTEGESEKTPASAEEEKPKEAEKAEESEDPATAAGNLLLETAKETDGQVAVFFKALGELLKKYGSAFYSFSPGGYLSSLTNEKFSDDEIAKMAAKATATAGNTVDLDMKLDETLATSLKAAKTSEEKSTMYVCSMLGLENMSKTRSLSSRLKSTKNGEKNLYKTCTEKEVYEELKADSFPRGSVIVFADNLAKMWEGATMCAYATGKGNEFVYYDPKTESTKSFNLGKGGSPINFVNIRSVFIRQPDAFVDAPEVAASEEPAAEPKPEAKPEEEQVSRVPDETDKIIDEIKYGPQSDPTKPQKGPSTESK